MIIKITEQQLNNVVKKVLSEIKRKNYGRPGVDKKQYRLNKEAPIGSEIICATCGTPMKKKTKAQAFCSRVCKDKYHNGISTDRHKDPNYYNKYNKAVGRTYGERFGTDTLTYKKPFDEFHPIDDLDYFNGEELLGDFYPGDN